MFWWQLNWESVDSESRIRSVIDGDSCQCLILHKTRQDNRHFVIIDDNLSLQKGIFHVIFGPRRVIQKIGDNYTRHLRLSVILLERPLNILLPEGSRYSLNIRKGRQQSNALFILWYNRTGFAISNILSIVHWECFVIGNRSRYSLGYCRWYRKSNDDHSFQPSPLYSFLSSRIVDSTPWLCAATSTALPHSRDTSMMADAHIHGGGCYPSCR
jgi:hypothetical protein